MKSLVALSLALVLAGCSKPSRTMQVDPNGPVEVVIPDHGAYTGAFMDFGDAEDDVTLETIEDFEEMVGKHQAIIVSSSYWGEQNFPTDNLNVIWRHGSLPLVFWSPWDKPYEEDRGPDKFGLTEILAGKWDAYIDKWADAARDFGHPMIVVFGVEMNGTWFPWSGAYYGGAQWVPEYNNWKGPETFRRAYRYVVDRVRARGASNIKWMFHTNNYPYPYETWNGAPAYYPGSDYVDWLGLSVYGQQYKDEPNPDIPSLVDWPYRGNEPSRSEQAHHDCGMGDRRISAYHGATQRYPQTGVDQTRSGPVSHPLSADQSSALLARALAKRRRLLQQSPREFFCGIASSVSLGSRPSRLARQFDSARNSKNVKLVGRDRRGRRSRLGELALFFVRAHRQNLHLAAS